MNYGEALTDDYQRWTIAHAILETAERFTQQEEEPAAQEFQLVVGGMKRTCRKPLRLISHS